MKARSDLQQAIVELRQRLGLTQQDLAIHLGKAVVTIARWETARPPRGESLAALVRVAKATGHEDLEAVFARWLGLSSMPPARPGAEGKGGMAAAVRQLREHMGCTQQDLAVRAGLTVRGIARYESGEREPTGKGLAQLAKVAAEMGHADLARLFARKLMEQLGLSHGDLQILADAAEADNEPR